MRSSVFVLMVTLLCLCSPGEVIGQAKQGEGDRHSFHVHGEKPHEDSISKWGGDVHQLVNRAATYHLPEDFDFFAQWVDRLEELSTAADVRRANVPSEGIRHYIDVDDYSQFFTGDLPQAYDDLVALYGKARVDRNGIAPWAIDSTYTDLVDRFVAGDWDGAVAKAADMGHYVTDIHNPMHLTLNFDGQFTGQTGIHRRHETQMTRRHLEELEPEPDTVFTIADPLSAVFEWIEQQYPGVELILAADLEAKRSSGGNTQIEVYYDVLWKEIGDETTTWIKQASIATASLWYAAWLEAGSPALPGSVSAKDELPSASVTRILPNAPNPFRTTTDLRVELAHGAAGELMVYDVSGRLVRQWPLQTGASLQTIRWDGTDASGRLLANGIYQIVFVDQKGTHAYGKAVLLR